MLKDYDIFYDKENQCYQVRTKSNVFVIEFDDDLKYKVFEFIIKNSERSNKSLVKDLLKEFDKAIITDVFYNLNEFGLLSENESDFIKEAFGIQKSNESNYEYCQTISNHDIVIIGKGGLSDKIKESLSALSLDFINKINIDTIKNDYDTITNIVTNHDFLVFDSSFWNFLILFD